jgi:hypothetical protein
VGARVRATDIEDDALPRVCVVTGEQGDRHWRVRYDNPAGALWLLLLFGILPFVIARLVTRHQVEGRLPISDQGIAIVRAVRRRGRISALVALGCAVVGLGAGFALASGLIAIVGVVVAVVIWVVTTFLYVDPVEGSVEQSGRWVRLTGTHPAFDRALTREPAPRTSF